MSAAIKAAAAGAVAVLCTESTTHTQAAQIHRFYLAALGNGEVCFLTNAKLVEEMSTHNPQLKAPFREAFSLFYLD